MDLQSIIAIDFSLLLPHDILILKPAYAPWSVITITPYPSHLSYLENSSPKENPY
jgi:hypothetical protein